MEGKRGSGEPRQNLLDWMMTKGYSKLKKEQLNIEKCGIIGCLDLPEGRKLKEEENA